ncbi:hypothetical protein [Kutzneria sp. 744]|uniref:hypothetical protein n=1 Tax=Kutzneria sp. (strain 744) TaxID=345341 RepID=UPI0012FC6870|nr:hypothetical protein [Kutzneria sp. 744]
MVINYYNTPNPTAGWGSLSTNIQALFNNDQNAYNQYWAGFSQVYGNGAFGVSDNPDGSVSVPVDVTFIGTDGSNVTQHKQIRVIRVAGQLRIDGDPRKS